MFASPFSNAFGLDISDLSVKIVQLKNMTSHRRHASFDIVTCASIEIPHGHIVNGDIIEPEKVRLLIQDLLNKHKQENKKRTPSTWVVVSLPDTQSFFKRITYTGNIQTISQEEVMSLAKQHMPVEDGVHMIDWQLLPQEDPDSTHAHILVGAVPKHIANTYTFLCESLDLNVIALELEPLAVARAMITANKSYVGEARAILDLGATRSSLIIYDNDSVQFSISIPFSGELITTTIAQKLNIPYAEAEEKKRSTGLDATASSKQVFNIIAEMAEQLSQEIKKAISFYDTHFEETNHITHITMCGGTANIKQLDTVLTTALGIESKPGKVFKNLMSQTNLPITDDAALSYASAIGLALRAADDPFLQRDMI